MPWYSAWKIGQLTNATTRFALANSGHIAGMINPPSRGRADTGSTRAATPEKRRQPRSGWQNATEHEGSWWENWTNWLEPRSGKKVDPPGVGSVQYPPIEDAPGTYVRER